jgi:hypothetical protein
MATMTVSETQTTLVVENLPLSIPLRTYAVSHDSAERAEPSSPMEQPSHVRNRGQEKRPSKLVTSNIPNTADSSPSTTQTLTPDSVDQRKQAKGIRDKKITLLKYYQELTESLQNLARRVRLFRRHGRDSGKDFLETDSFLVPERNKRNMMSFMDLTNSSMI